MKKKFNHKLGLNDEQIERLSDSNAMKIMGGEESVPFEETENATFGTYTLPKLTTAQDGIPKMTPPKTWPPRP